MEKSVSRVAGDSSLAGCLLYAIVGNDNSSATNGSSVASVAGKNRFPANPCAETGSVATRLEAAASTASNGTLIVIERAERPVERTSR